MYDDILFPTDGSEGAERALDHVAGLASEYGATVHVLYVVDISAESLILSSHSVDSILKEMTEEGEKITEETVEKLESVDVETRSKINREDPYKGILGYTDEVDADMIVMGTRGRRGIARYALGSVTERVVRRSPRPVLTVRDIENNSTREVPKYENVLIPTDGSEDAEEGVKHGIEIASKYDASVHAVYVSSDSSSERRAGEKGIENVCEKAEEKGLKYRKMTLEGVPHKEIIDYSEENEIDLITMGTEGRTGLDRYLIGSVAERVVRKSEPPVLTARRDKQKDS